jgi:hypothetical protein
MPSKWKTATYTAAEERQYWEHLARQGDARACRILEELTEVADEADCCEPRRLWVRRDLWVGCDYYFDQGAILEPCESGPSGIAQMLEQKDRIGGKAVESEDDLYAANRRTRIGRKAGVGGRRPSGWMPAESDEEPLAGRFARIKDFDPAQGGGGSGFKGHSGNMKADGTVYLMRNRRSVWTIPTAPYRGAHFATFPEKLVEPMILAATKPGDIVLDPFVGSGTTAVVATRLGRRFIGIDISESYLRMAVQRIGPQQRLIL